MFIPTGSIGGKPRWVSGPTHPFRAEQVVDDQEIARLGADAMVIVGSHGVNHSNSRDLADAVFLRELGESRRRLEAATGRPVTSFSFPHGKFLPKHIGLAQTAGYTRAFSIEPTYEKLEYACFLLGRVAIDPSDWGIEFYLKVSGAYRWQTWKFLGRNAGE
jgi:peptidoglycan/xylan/chitin deacetylase (PgdA/CDA1 family)